MFRSYYKLKISGKDVKRFIRMLYKLNIYFEDIIFDNKCCYIKVDKECYEKICNVKTSYEIELIDLLGMKKIESFFKKNFVFILSSIVGVFFLFFLSCVIFDVEVVHNDKEIRKIIFSELEKYGISKYNFVKSYSYLQEVKENILNANKDSIEWLEIERVGTKYRIRVEKRIINNLNDSFDLKHIVAKKNGIIMKIKAEKGEVLKKINDYVKEGDIIISGSIYRNDKVVDNIEAKGDVFAEVWYKVKVDIPKNYKEMKLTGNLDKFINIKFVSNELNLFDDISFDDKKIDNILLFQDFFGLFSINYDTAFEVFLKEGDEEGIAMDYAKNKIEKNLRDDEYIISQKKLKTTVNNSTISTEIFFKVYENISYSKSFTPQEGL